MKKTNDIFERVTNVIKKLLQVNRAKDLRETPPITMQTDIYDDLGIDSLEIMDLIASLEKEFNISVVPQDLSGKSKIQDIVEEIQRGMNR